MGSLRLNWPKGVMLAAGAMVSALGAAVLVGWHLHFIPLIQVLPTLAPMQRMTALGFLLSGLGLVFDSLGRKRIATLCALVVFLEAVIVALEYALGADFGIDQLMGRDYVYANVRTSHVGRMSPMTSLCFIASSLALLVMASRRPARFTSAIVGVVASVLMAVGTVSVLGYLLGHSETYGCSHLTGMALHSSAAFVLVGAGLLGWAWQDSRAKTGAPEWLPLSLGLGLACGALGVWQALTLHQESELPLLSGIILSGGILGSLLVAIAVAQAQRARKHSLELQAGGAMLQQLFETSPDGLITINRQGRILHLNKQGEAIFGYSHGELVGTPVDNLVPQRLREQLQIHREGYYAAPSPRPMSRGLELNALRKDGSEFPVEIVLTPLQTSEDGFAIVAVVRDITERKQAEAALRESETAFVTLANSVPQMVWMCTPDGLNVYFNQRWVEYTGLTLEESYGRGWNTPFHPDDKQAAWDAWNRATATGAPYRVESRLRAADGSYRWFLMRGLPLQDAAGNTVKWFGTCTDIDDLKRAEQELQESEARLQLQIDRMPIGCMVFSKDFRIQSWNPAAERIFGFTAKEVVGQHPDDCIVPPDLQPQVDAAFARLLKGDQTAHSTNENLTKDGRRITCEWTNTPLRGSDGTVYGILSMAQDITERKQEQEALRVSEERFRGLFEQGPIGVALLGSDHRMTRANPAFCRMLGYSEAEMAKMTPLDITLPDDRESCGEVLGRLDSGEIPVCRLEKRYVKKNGEVIWISLTASVIRDREGRPLNGLGLVEDITERRQAEQKLMEQAALLDLAQDSIAVRDLAGRIIFWSRGAKDTYGWSAEEAMGRVDHELLQSRFSVPLKEIEAAVATQGAWEGELEQTTRDGKKIVVTSRWSAWRDEHGAPRAFLVINRDITERKRAEEELKSTQQKLALALAAGQMGVWSLDLTTDQAWRSLEHDRIFGYTQLLPTWSAEIFFSHVFSEDREPVKQAFAQASESGRLQFECRITRADNILRWISVEGSVVYDEQHSPVRMMGIVQDITERKEMEAQIEASARLSALGMMAGGVAHEINNPLAIIHASAGDLLRRAREEGAVPVEIVVRTGERMLQTANRITKIIKSMRHLAREGSRDRPSPTPVAKIVEETVEICKERFKNHSVNLLLPSIDPALCVSCREVQIEQVLLNLLQNAFDAVVEQAGEKWVRLDVAVQDGSVAFSVIDSGPGIPSELRTRIMEPFFTTKEVGKGAGLGLSLSRTIVEEHGGTLGLTEEAGHNCFSFRLSLAQQVESRCN